MSNHSKQYLDFNGLTTYHEGTKILHGYYNSSNGNFYKESTYITLISPQEKRLYVDLGSDIIYEYKNNAYVALTGTGSYNNLSNKPSINNVSLSGNKTSSELGLGTVTSVKVGSTSYEPESGIVSLPAYPTTLPASDVSAWAKASTKPSYSASEISGLSAAATTAIDTIVTQSSSNLITSGAVYTAIDNLPNPMVFKGTLGSGGTITSLPAASSSNEGYTYKVITAGTYASQSAKVGDVFVSNSSSWVLIPAGDEDTDTWRNIKVNGTELLGTGISTGYVNFKNGNGISVSGNSHDVTIEHSNSVTAGTAKGDNDKTLEFGGTFTIPSVTYDAQGHITAKGTTTMTMPANPNFNTIPSAYCASGSSVVDKVASCTGFALLNKSYLHVLIRNNNTVESALTLNVNSTGAKAIYINGTASSSTNYTLPAGTYLVYYASNIFYFRTDGKLTANITGTAGYSSKAAASGGTDVSLVTTGEKYTWNNKSDFDGAYASLSGKPTLGTAAALDVAASGDASSTQVVLGNDSRLTSNIIASSTQPSGQPTGGIWLKIE